MTKEVKLTLIVIGIIILLVLAYYLFVVRASQKVRSETSGTNGIGNNPAPQPTFTVGENVYLNLDAPAPGQGYTTDETVVYNTPIMGNSAVGKLLRSWYGNQPIGTVIQDLGDKVKVQVGKVSDFRVFPFTSSGFAPNSSLIIPSGTGSQDVFFYKEYLTNVQY